jgi:large subunit ribosomal protein L7/L12
MTKRKTPEQQLAALEKKQAQLDARIQKKRATVRMQKRKDDTRRKIIAGALALEHMSRDASFRATMGKLLDEHVPREIDRKLFDL